MIAGVDGCKAGWLLAVADGWPCRKAPLLYVCRSFQGVLELTARCAIVVVDIPIGLPSGSEIRACDQEAIDRLGKDGQNRVFLTPPRETLAAQDVNAFQAAHRKARGVGAGYPVWGIVPKLIGVDRLMTPAKQRRVREFHPELTWARLANQTAASKHGPEGIAQRMALLEGSVPGLDSIVIWKKSLGRAAKLDDVLDALVGLAVAEDIRKGANSHHRLPAGKPPRDARGLRMEIWF